jgi:hypothetical protein
MHVGAGVEQGGRPQRRGAPRDARKGQMVERLHRRVLLQPARDDRLDDL